MAQAATGAVVTCVARYPAVPRLCVTCGAHCVPVPQAVYVFPLPAGAALIAFRYTTAGRTITGQVEERSNARATYHEALSRNDTAALLEQSDASADVFSAKVGNLAPGQQARTPTPANALVHCLN